jgi:hypothetical protein
METKKLNINGLREILAEEIEKLREGQTNAANVNAVTNATGKILSTVKLEMEYSKLVGKTPDISFIQLKEHKEQTKKIEMKDKPAGKKE